MYNSVKLKNYLRIEPGLFEELFTMVEEPLTTKKYKIPVTLTSFYDNDRKSASLAAMFIIIIFSLI